MKISMNKSQNNDGITFEQLDAKADRRLKELRDKSMLNISVAAEKGMDPNIVLAEANAEIEEIKAFALQWFLPQSNQLTVHLEQMKLDRIRQAIEQNLRPIIASLEGCRIEIQRISRTYPQKSYWQAKLGIFCAVALDAIFSYRAMQVVAPNLIASLVTTGAAVGVLAWAAHIIGKKMRAAKTRKEKIIWFCSGLLGGAIVFMTLSIFRQIFFGEGNAFVNVLLWTLTNLFFFTIALLISAYALPSKEEEEMAAKLKGWQKEEEKLLQSKRNEEDVLAKAENEHRNAIQQMGRLKSLEINMMQKFERQKQTLHAALLLEYELKGGRRNYYSKDYKINEPN